ncbi:hypothetical protein O181_100161 [Austropuccinia psidii MF-1]|uniref:Uncharacterized protein n=1 Tax=Austropuccinia psidii MF-1 TaxID=1389203 RepID=A0A9Q3JEV2_9BASI|nr:hypothetical protein [Austropuccinia psidii MF-1]
MEGEETSRRSRSFSGLLGTIQAVLKGLEVDYGEESVEEEYSEETEVADAPGASDTPKLACSNQPLALKLNQIFSR